MAAFRQAAVRIIDYASAALIGATFGAMLPAPLDRGHGEYFFSVASSIAIGAMLGVVACQAAAALSRRTQ
jgi:hypothetical protein